MKLNSNSKCAKCEDIGRRNKSRDHIHEKSDGGDRTPENIQILCRTPCHDEKSTLFRLMRKEMGKKALTYEESHRLNSMFLKGEFDFILRRQESEQALLEINFNTMPANT